MIPRRLMFILCVVVVASLAGTFFGASWSNRWLFAASAFVFSFTASIAAFVVNRQYWRGDAASGAKNAAIPMLIASTNLSALVYGWGATALLLVYSATGLYWQHGWQYGLAMALIAAGMLQYVKRLDQGHPAFISENAIERAVMLASVQGIMTSLVLLWLVASGKILTPRTDWAANLIFVAGGLSIVCLSAFVTKTYHELTRAKDSSK
jgi:hypothetical protein